MSQQDGSWPGDVFRCDVPTAFRISTSDQAFEFEKYPVLAPLPEYPASPPARPRLILTPQRLEAIRRDTQDGFLKDIWPEIWRQHQQNYLLKPGEVSASSRDYSYMLVLRALRWAVMREPAVLQETIDWLGAIVALPIDNHLESLVGSEVVSAVALTLDWAADDLPAELASKARWWIAAEASQIARAASSGAVWWADTWLQNHTIVNECGIGLAGMALVDAPEQELRQVGLQLYRHAVTGFRKAVFYQPPDGSSPELCRYAYFMFEAQFTFFEALRSFSGEDLYGSFARERIDYIIHQMIPAPNTGGDILNWGDNDRSCWPHPPVGLLYCLARRFNQPLAQGAADRLVRRGVGVGKNKSWLIPLMRDPSIAPLAFPPKDGPLPCSYHAADQGLVTLRSDWGDDAVMVGALCGPFQGHRLRSLVNKDMGAAHRHPDNAAIQMCVGSTYLLLDPGYEYLKSTANHNTILIDGQGQTGDGNSWLNVNNCLNREGKALRVEAFEDKGEFCHVVMQAAGAYDPDLQIESFWRQLIFVRPDLLIVHDRLESPRPHEYRWMLHTETRLPFTEMRPGYWRLDAGAAGLDICVLLPSTSTLCHEVRMHRVRRGRFVPQTRRLDLRATQPVQSGEFLVVLKVLRGPAMKDAPTTNFELQQTPEQRRLSVGNMRISWAAAGLELPEVAVRGER